MPGQQPGDKQPGGGGGKQPLEGGGPVYLAAVRLPPSSYHLNVLCVPACDLHVTCLGPCLTGTCMHVATVSVCLPACLIVCLARPSASVTAWAT